MPRLHLIHVARIQVVSTYNVHVYPLSPSTMIWCKRGLRPLSGNWCCCMSRADDADCSSLTLHTAYSPHDYWQPLNRSISTTWHRSVYSSASESLYFPWVPYCLTLRHRNITITSQTTAPRVVAGRTGCLPMTIRTASGDRRFRSFGDPDRREFIDIVHTVSESVIWSVRSVSSLAAAKTHLNFTVCRSPIQVSKRVTVRWRLLRCQLTK